MKTMISTALAALLAAAAGCTGNAAIGEACVEKTDCASGYCITESVRDRSTGFTGGYCAQDCATVGCPAGSACTAIGEGSICLATCGAAAAQGTGQGKGRGRDGGAAECRAGYVCNPVALACLPDCRAGFACGDSLACGPDGACVDPATLPAGSGTGAVGTACASASTCATTLCIPEKTPTGAVTGWTGGYCAQLCPPGTTCPAESACHTLAGTPYCLDQCAGDADCRATYICDTDWNACLPDCRLGWPCGPTMACDEGGTCKAIEAQPDGGAPTDGGDGGPHRGGDGGGMHRDGG